MSEPHGQLRPICFMIMPFRRRPVPDPRPAGAPTELDCDALWDKAYRPALEQLGYVPVRADHDAGSVIVKDMLERLALADLVLADVTLPNGNVYYEVGLRHVARETSCVLVAASWSRQLFDVEQFRSIRYELSDGSVPDAEAAAIRECLVEGVPRLKDGRTPYHEFLSGSLEDLRSSGVFHDVAERLSAFQARARQARLHADGDRRRAHVEEMRAEFTGSALEIPEVAIELMCLLRDHVGFDEQLAFLDTLPRATRDLPYVREQELLARSKIGEHEESIARLEELVTRFGDSEERQGLIGGRYKALWKAARDDRVRRGDKRESSTERRWLARAIDHYTRGMEQDYNRFYCASNLPLLLRTRAREGDVERARIVEHFVVAACRRALDRGEDDGWVRPTLLGAAFRAGDTKRAAELAERIEDEGVVAWKLGTTLSDLAEAVVQTEDTAARGSLHAILEDLTALHDETS